jgi:hypothetical protein
MKRRFKNRGTWKRENKYTVIVKIDPLLQLGNKGFAKWSYVRNLLKFTAFLDRKYPYWCFMNVFDRKTRQKLASFTKFRKPTSHSV